MIHFHDLSEASLRACCATNAQNDDSAWLERDYFAGYCLDAIEEMPAGATMRIDPGLPDPYVREPFATPERSWRGY
jgi:hypothetical protein